MHYDLRATLGGLIVSALILGVIVTMEPATRLMHLAIPVPAAPQAKYQLSDTATASLVPLRKLMRPRIPSQSRETP